MNHAYIPYDLVINEPILTCSKCGRELVNDEPHRLGECFKPGTVVRKGKSIGIANDDGWIYDSEGWAFGNVYEWEPIPADDPANIYPGDKVVCVEDRHKGIRDWTGELANVVKRGNQLYIEPDYLATGSVVTPQNSLFDWAILEPATTPTGEIEEGDEVVCRGPDWTNSKGTVEVEEGFKGVWLFGLRKREWVFLSNRQWLVTKKAAKKDTLTTEEQDRLGTLIYGYALGRALRPVDIGHIIDDCIKRSWWPQHDLPRRKQFRFVNTIMDQTSWHPYTLTGIARAYVEAREKWG